MTILPRVLAFQLPLNLLFNKVVRNNMLRLIAAFIFLLTYLMTFLLSLENVQATDDIDLSDVVNLKDNLKDVVSSTITNSTITFKDKDYKEPSNKFQGNDIVYIRFNTSSSGELKQEILLLDSNKNKIQTIELSKQGQNPIIYSGSFKMPKEIGQYYLSINIKDNENSFSFEQNIEVTTEGMSENDNDKVNIVTPEDKKNIVSQDYKNQIIKEKETYTRQKEEFNLIKYVKAVIVKLSDFVKSLFDD